MVEAGTFAADCDGWEALLEDLVVQFWLHSTAYQLRQLSLRERQTMMLAVNRWDVRNDMDPAFTDNEIVSGTGLDPEPESMISTRH